MNRELIRFQISAGVENLIAAMEKSLGREIRVEEMPIMFDTPEATAAAGMKGWIPQVAILPGRIDAFDEHALAHELLHLKRMVVEGVYTLISTEEVAGDYDAQGANEKMHFTSDITNEIEHVAIFPELEKLGFDPHASLDKAKARALKEGGFRNPNGIADIQRSWLCFQVAFVALIGRDLDLTNRMREMIAAIYPEAIPKGAEIERQIRVRGIQKQGLKHLYEKTLKLAGVPRRALRLKEINWRARKIEYIPIP